MTSYNPEPYRGRKPAPTKADGGPCSCPMGVAVRSARRGKLRLARRYAQMSVRLIVERVVA